MVQCGRAACMFSIPVSVCFEKPYSRGLVWRCHQWWGCARLTTGASGNAAKPRRFGLTWKGMPDTQLLDRQPIKSTQKSSQERVQRRPNIVVNKIYAQQGNILWIICSKNFWGVSWTAICRNHHCYFTHGCTTWLFQHVMPGHSRWLMCERKGLALAKLFRYVNEL